MNNKKICLLILFSILVSSCTTDLNNIKENTQVNSNLDNELKEEKTKVVVSDKDLINFLNISFNTLKNNYELIIKYPYEKEYYLDLINNYEINIHNLENNMFYTNNEFKLNVINNIITVIKQNSEIFKDDKDFYNKLNFLLLRLTELKFKNYSANFSSTNFVNNNINEVKSTYKNLVNYYNEYIILNGNDLLNDKILDISEQMISLIYKNLNNNDYEYQKNETLDLKLKKVLGFINDIEENNYQLANLLFRDKPLISNIVFEYFIDYKNNIIDNETFQLIEKYPSSTENLNKLKSYIYFLAYRLLENNKSIDYLVLSDKVYPNILTSVLLGIEYRKNFLNIDNSIDYFEKAISFLKKNEDTFNNYSFNYISELKDKPNHIYYYLADLYFRKKNYDKSLFYYNKYISTQDINFNFKNPESFFGIADIYKIKGDDNKYITYIEELSNKNFTYFPSKYYQDLANYYKERKDYKKSSYFYNKAG